MSNRLGGKQGTSYLGTNANQPPNWTFNTRDPNQYDTQNVSLGDLWMNTDTDMPWILVSLTGNSTSKGMLATWIELTGNGANEFITNAGTAVPLVGVLNVLGTSPITTTGAGNTVTILTDGTLATEYVTNSGTAVPAGGILNVSGGHGLNTSGAFNTVTTSINNSIILGDLTPIAAGSDAISLSSGDLFFAGNNLVAATNQMIRFANANRISFFLNSIFMGSGSGNTTCTGLFNYAYGASTMPNITSGNRNCGFGNGALNDVTTGAANCSMGYVAASSITTGNSNTYLGDSCGEDATTGNGNTAVGQCGLCNLTTGSNNTALGNNTGTNGITTAGVTTGSNNIIIGHLSASTWTSSESNNIIIGNAAVIADANIIRIGAYGTSADQQNKCYIASCYANPGTANTFVGELSGNITLTGAGTNTAVGFTSLHAVTTASGVTAVGNLACSSITTGGPNEAFGSGALQSETTGGSNVAIGFTAMQQANGSTFNVAVGQGALNKLTTGTANTAVGRVSMDQLLTGSNNTTLGVQAGHAYTGAESSNIIIANSGTNGESNVIKIGVSGAGSGQPNQCFIAGIRGITTGAADAIPVLISSTGQLGTVSSSMRYKENIKPMADASSPIMNLEPKTFNFKSRQTKQYSYGLIAEEVQKVMPQLVVYDNEGQPDSVMYHDLPVLLLNEMKKLQQRIIDLESRMNACQK